MQNYLSLHKNRSFLDDQLLATKQGDFLVDNKYTFVLTLLRDSVTLHEIGGKNKGFEQIKDLPNSFQGNFASQPLYASFVVADEIEIGFGNKIPLWLFGFLY